MMCIPGALKSGADEAAAGIRKIVSSLLWDEKL